MPPTSYDDVLAAYEGVETLERFDDAALRAYREELASRTEAQAAFVAARLPAGARVLEIGSGNGRLLIALAGAAALAEGVGLEIAESRVRFARAWADDERLPGLRFDVADALTAALDTELDAVLCITGAFAYFDAIRPGSAAELLRRAHAALRPGGLLVLELYPHRHYRRLLEAAGTGELRLWQELPAGDPWRLYLSHLVYDAEQRVLTHHKTFVHRTSGEIDDSRREHLRLYDAAEVAAELRTAGFGEIATYGGWSDAAPSPGDELLVVCALRA